MRLAPICVVVGIALQFGIPAWQLTKPGTQRFGWQMYSAVLPMPRLAAVDEGGAETPLRHADFLAFPRADLPADAWRGMLPHICQVRPGTLAVRYRLHDEAPWEEWPCH